MIEARRSRARWACGLAVLVAAALADSAAAERASLGPIGRPRIVNGVDSHDYPTVGALLYGAPNAPITADTASIRCSGTLIGCRTFLTAGHCVSGIAPQEIWVYLQHAGLLTVESIARHPDYDFPAADVAVLRLGAPVTGIDPTPINLVDPFAFIPAGGIIAGFGRSGGGADYGIKRAGAVETAACLSGLSNDPESELVCWDFLDPIGPAGEDSNTCNGDSGGPLLLDLGGGAAVAGITSGGTSSNCLPADQGFDANVSTYASFILAQLGADPTATCGGLPPVGDAQVEISGFNGTLDGSHTSDTYAVSVPAGSNSARFALNGLDDGVFDADLYVKASPGVNTADYGCKADADSVFGACIFDLPAPATYSVLVQRAAGSGDYQLTATVFGGSPPVCGNDMRDFTEQCDGVDSQECSGLCRPDCSCPPPLCGNDVRETGEQCDGTDDGACPGACLVGCSCPVPCVAHPFYRVKLKADAEKLRFRSRLANYQGTFTGRDPRNGFTFVLAQGAAVAGVQIPPGDPGWAESQPAKRRYKWRGALNGVTRVKAIDRTARNGTWKILVVGKAVPGAGAIDVAQPVDISLTIDGACAGP
jgi:Trypsin/Bacterial pre-peptidase C-terminal domain